MEITLNEMLNVLNTINKPTFVHIVMETPVRMNKTGNPYFNQVIKITKGNILMGNSYQTRVQNETGNTNFVSQECKVGSHISKCVLHNDNTGKDYLQYEWFENVLPKSEYKYNGNPIEKQLFQDFMGTYTPNKNGVNFQSVTIDNIKECHFNGNEYRVVNPQVEIGVGNGVEQVKV